MNTTIDLQTQTAPGYFPQRHFLTAVPEIPREIAESPLMKRGGFDVFSGIADEAIRKSMLSEAFVQQALMTESLITGQDTEEIRGGAPRRKFLSSSGGEFQKSFYQSDWLNDFLRELTTPHLRPTGQHGTFTYYSRQGDFLEIHRDILACDVAVITCLENRFGDDRSGGKLCLYPARTKEKLSEIRSTPNEGAHEIFLEEGQTLVMYGGIVPHALLPIAENQSRIVSVLCYEAL